MSTQPIPETCAAPPAASTPSTGFQTGAILRSWAVAVTVKQGRVGLALRALLLPAVASALGALFTLLGPSGLRVDADGVPDVDSLHFLFLGYLVFGQVILVVALAWLHLRDTHSRELGLTYIAVPQRWVVVLGTVIVAGLLALVSAVVSVAVVLTLSAVLAGVDPLATLALPRALNLVVGLPVAAVPVTAMGVSVAVLIRRPFVAVVVIVAWMTMVEDFLNQIPGVGATLARLAPLNNAYALAGVSPEEGLSSNPLLCAVWLLVLAGLAVAAAAMVEQRRPGWVPD